MNGLRLILASVGSVAVLSVSVWLALRRRITPAERERRRRMALYEKGRMAEADVNDFGGSGETVYYSYSVRGVSYEASQDLSALLQVLQVDSVASLGPATCRYDPRNPANSIVACEDWSGLRARPRASSS